ncbi:protein kinase [Stieleria sp. ICT_E10.1]|uniref:serine/threonine-protein kinase n=1 Tax=Stieleria sedimenti TaxID=2976331 RepID=UPI00217FB9A1|nr:serine/threonine-protein kinase [Stieleria sedimenti]MCS7468386.1 protein kinase [Stieleria sedimenti]
MENQEPTASDSTVHRTPGQSADGPRQPPELDPTTDEVFAVRRSPKGKSVKHVDGEGAVQDVAPGLEEAKTVIRQAASGQPKSAGSGRTPADIAKVLVGEQLNQYFLEALIGGGGMGAVFRAHDQQLDRIVALKVIPFVGNDPELQRRFRNEAQNAAKLDHPRIARVFDAGNYDDWHYIVFEYINGTNVRDLVDHHGVLSLDDAVVFTSQVAEALDHASQRGIVHRDIKPSNVLVSEDGSVKLVDMGLARSDNLDLSEDMTASGVTLGTFDYISPEQAFDPRDADIRSDLYSLGCTFYFMLTGEAPYTGGTMLQKLISHGNAPLPNPKALRPDLPDEATAVMHRMMAKDPQSRYQNARDLLADLSELAYRFQLKRAQSIAVVTLPSGNEGLQRLQLHLPWMIAALLILMIGGYLELQSTATRDAFVINRPASLSRTGSTRPSLPPSDTGGSGADAARSDGSDSDRLPPSPSGTFSDSNPVSNGSDSSPPDGSTSQADRVGPGTIDSPPVEPGMNLDDVSEAAARPPSFGARLPLPDMLGSDDDLPAASFEDNTAMTPNEGDEAEFDSTTAGLSASAAGGLAAAGSAVGTGIPEAIRMNKPNGSAPVVSPTRPVMPAELPAPQSVRVVSPSLLALSMRVDQIDRDTDGAILVATLTDAIDLAMRFGVGRVELATEELVTGPLTIPQDNMVFESTVGRTAIRMVSTDTLAIGRSEMLNIGNHRTQFRNLDFHWELAQEQVDGGSMFVLNDNRLTRFQNCTFTLVNKAIHDRVSFFQIVTDPKALPDSETLPGRILNPNEDALPLVAIQLDNAVVRGEATLVEMDYAAALQLVWKNGLLAISGRMIDTSGARRLPTPIASPIQLSLSNVTAEIPRGLVRMRLGPDGIFPVPIEREANQCVFLIEDGQPHVEIIGVETLATERPYLKLRGEDNAYVGAPTLSDPLLSVSDLAGNTSVYMMEELAAQSLPWIDERRPRWSVRWSSVRPRSQTYHRLTPTHYRQDGAIYFGFQEPDLPSLP